MNNIQCTSFDKICPICGGKNSIEHGGNEKCFHCGTCWFVECNYSNNPVDEIYNNILTNPYHKKLLPDVENIKQRLIEFYKQ